MPYRILTRITGVPAYDTIKISNDELTSNAVTDIANLSCGTGGYACFTLTATTYFNISIAAWITPVNPSAQPKVYANATSTQITSINHTFNHAFIIYQAYITSGNAFKNQLI